MSVQADDRRERSDERRLGLDWRRSVVALVAIVLIAALALGWWTTHKGAAGLADPTDVALPAKAADVNAVEAFFAGRGAKLLLLLALTRRPPERRPDDACAALVESVTAVGEPAELLTLAQAIPDPSLRDAAMNHVDAVMGYVGACRANADYERARARLHFTSTVFNRILHLDGVR